MANEFKETLKNHIKLSRRRQKPGTRARSRKKKPESWLYPRAIERQYWKSIKKEITSPLRGIVEPTVRDRAGEWLKEASFLDSSDRIDTWTEEVQQLLSELDKELEIMFGAAGAVVSDSRIWAVLRSVADSVWDFNLKQWNKSTKAVAGFEFETSEAWWASVRDPWMEENFRLIKNISEDYANRISETIYRGVRQRLTVDEIVREVRKVGGNISEARARLIAVDQIGKLNGQLTKMRNTEAGANIYLWNTQKDERVRGRPGGLYPNAVPSHWDIEGMWCRWDNSGVFADPAVDVVRTEDKRRDVVSINWRPRTGLMPHTIPGEAIRCRCTGGTVWEPILQEVDEEITEEERPNV
jgi:hypothetical protein